ncbi:YaiI/YqxD family protein, partial [Mesorhizobium sp. M2C.T.Ca.TU.009.01.2.1]
GESRGFNASFTQKDRSQFLGELDRILRRALKSVTPD